MVEEDVEVQHYVGMPPSKEETDQQHATDGEEKTNEVLKPTYTAAGVARTVVAFVIICGLSQLFAYLGEGSKDQLLGFDTNLTIMQTTAVIAILIQIVAFVPSFLAQSEKYYDLTGSLTYITCILYTLFAGSADNDDKFSPRAIAVTCLVLVWCMRLGYFLFRRVLRAGKDGRFDEIKINFFRFLIAWSLQGLWVFLTAFAAFIINSDQTDGSENFVASDFIGLVVWLLGFAIEVVADHQKTAWRAREDKPNPFIDTGLWYYSRHPNYFGEMVLWLGIFILSIEVLDGRQYAAAFSPVFVFLLINYVSGVRLLENRSDEKFGHLEAYWDYKRNTSSLVLLPRGVCGAKNAGPKSSDQENAAK